MGFVVHADITPRAAARLLLSGEIDLAGLWLPAVVGKTFDELLELSMDEILQMIDHNPYGQVAEVRHIPQFGKLDTVMRVPYYFVHTGQTRSDYAQLGFFLKNNITASLSANTKFGENHGKAAALIGIADCVDKRIVLSALTDPFCALDHEKQEMIFTRLLFRIPVVQIILRQAAQAPVNGYDAMAQLGPSTRTRRGQSLRSIFHQLRSYHDASLNARLDHVFWEESEDACDTEV